MIRLYLYAAAGLALIGLLWWGYNTIEGRGYNRAMAECEQRAKAQREAEARQAAAASSTLEAKNAKAKVVYRTITKQVDKIVDRPIYRNVCLDDDGMRSANAALRGTLAPAGESDSGLSGPNTARGRDWLVGPAKTDRDSGNVLLVPKESRSAGGGH